MSMLVPIKRINETRIRAVPIETEEDKIDEDNISTKGSINTNQWVLALQTQWFLNRVYHTKREERGDGNAALGGLYSFVISLHQGPAAFQG